MALLVACKVEVVASDMVGFGRYTSLTASFSSIYNDGRAGMEELGHEMHWQLPHQSFSSKEKKHRGLAKSRCFCCW